MDNETRATLTRLTELAKAEFGEYKEELIGYEMGVNCHTEVIWSGNVFFLEQLTQEDDAYGEPTRIDLMNRERSNEEFYWYDDYQYVIARRVKVTNKGWKLMLLDLVRNL